MTGSNGLAYTPKGDSTRIAAMSAEYYFHSHGEFALELPAGETTIEATRGQEYELARAVVPLKSGEPAEVVLPLKRWYDSPAAGWWAADAHIHANYTAPHHQVISPDDVRLQVEAEDLNVANLLVANSSSAFLHDAQSFEGKPNRLSTERHIIYWNEEMRNGGMYGHMTLFNLKKLIYPLFTGFRQTLDSYRKCPGSRNCRVKNKPSGRGTFDRAV